MRSSFASGMTGLMRTMVFMVDERDTPAATNILSD